MVLSVARDRTWGGCKEVDLRCSVCCVVVRPFFGTTSHVFKGGSPARGAEGGWLTTPLFIAQSTAASVQAHYFMYGVSYRCHPVSCLSDVSLLYKIDIPVPDRVQRAKDCIYTTSQSSLRRVVEVVLLGCPWLLYVCPGLNQWIM